MLYPRLQSQKSWNNAYLNIPVAVDVEEKPSDEDLARIEEFKKKGWI